MTEATTDARADGGLDNAVWHALHSRQSPVAEAEATRRAWRFHPEVSIFSAVERVDAVGWAALADLVGPKGFAVLFRDAVPPAPAGWTETFRDRGFQLVARALPPAPDLPVCELGEADVPEMLALTELTEPGPFLPRTIDLGSYVGIRREGRLVAMAGERFDLPGFTEISAVCTHPDAQRQGLGAALTLCVAHRIRARGDEAFLHVLEHNENALRLYRSLGFDVRRTCQVMAAQRDG